MDNFLNIFGKTNKSTKITPTIPYIFAGEYFYSLQFETTFKQRVLVDLYNKLPEIQIPVNFIIDNLANVPIKHVRVLSNDNEVPITNSTIIATLFKPNQFDTYSTFVKRFLLNRLINGIGYINMIKPVGLSTTTQLYVLNSHMTKIEYQKGQGIDARLFKIDKIRTDFGFGALTLDPKTIAVDYEASLQNKYTKYSSRLYSAVLASDNLRYNYEASLKLLKDRGALGIISPSDAMTVIDKEMSSSLKKAYLNNNGVVGTKSPFMVSTVPLDYTPISFNAKDLDLTESRKRDFAVICNLFKIDPVLFSTDNSTKQDQS
jgi:hypothetical protein